MKNNYKLIAITLFAVVGLLSSEAAAQDFTVCSETVAECEVAYHSGDFVPINNALRNTVANDTLNGERKHPDRVYILETGGMYMNIDPIVNSGFHLRIRTQTEAEVGAENYFGPAKIQIKTDEVGGSSARLMTVQGDLTLDGVFMTGMHDGGSTGNYLPIRVGADGARIIVKNSIFEQTDFALFGFDSGNNKVYFYDNVFRNQINKTQQWEGRGIRFEAGADTLVIENTTYLNIGMTILQSEAGPINYTRFMHNTIINVGRLFNAGNFWKEGYVANNLFVNHYWHGEGFADNINDPSREYPFTGFFSVGPVAPGVGFPDLGRRVVYTNNAHWRDPAFAAYYADSINAQPVFNTQADSMFDTFSAPDGLGGFYRNNNWEGTDPGIVAYTTAPEVRNFEDELAFPATQVPLEDIVPLMIDNIRDLREGRQNPFTYWGWDPGRDPAPASFSVQSVLPGALNPGDFSYTDETYKTAGTDGLPLGNLNYHDGARADWEANKESYIADVQALAGAVIELEVVGSSEAEDGTTSGTADIFSFDGFAFLDMESAGFIEWEFTASAGATDLNVTTNLNGNGVRGQRVIVNGTSIKDCLNYGEYIWDAEGGQGGCANPHQGMPTDEWTVTKIENSALHESTTDGLVLVEGTNTIRLEPSWGFQGFAAIEVVEAGTENVVAELTPLNADYSQVIAGGQTEMNGEDVEGIPSRFKSVTLGENGAVTVDFGGGEFDAGTYRIQVFFSTDESADVTYTVNGEELQTTELLSSGSSHISDAFMLDANGTIMVEVAGGTASIDFIDLIKETAVGVSNEPVETPNGFALSQNYPNPFNPSTNINFTLPVASDVQLTVYNLLGQKVATLVDDARTAGNHTVRFDARSLASGVYFYQLKAGDFTLQRRMTLIK